MEQYIKKNALVAEIKRKLKINKECMLGLRNLDYYQGKVDALNDTISSLDTLEVKEIDLELITSWFDHIAQIADDRMTLTNQRMTDAHALCEIKCLAKNSTEFITKHYSTERRRGMTNKEK